MMDTTNNWKLAAGLSAAAAVASGAVAGMLISKLKPTVQTQGPKKWVKVGEVSQQILYPVKSCQGVKVEVATATFIGLKASDFLRDRVFMVVDSGYVFQSQRTIPMMSRITVGISGKDITMSGPDVPGISVKIPQDSPELRRSCRIFYDDVPVVLDCGDEIGKWLDKFLGKTGLRLVYHFLDKTQREISKLQKQFPMFLPLDKGTFQNQTSYMLMSEESITELNTELENQVSHTNFRPSILIKGISEPFAEDFWTFVKVGKDGPIFKAAKPCIRCKITTVNPDTGAFFENGEPLSFLSKMKRSVGDEKVDALIKNQGILGLQLGLYAGEGKSMKVGDSVYAAVL